MNKAEIVDLLQFASNYDRRDITDGEVDAWHGSLRQLELDDARYAVAEHYQRDNRRIMPADVRSILHPPASRHPSSVPVPTRLDVSEFAAVRGMAKLREAADRAKAVNQARRERVLRHPDLAKKLTEPPLSYGRAEQWNGFVPPAELQDEAPEGLHSSALDGGFPNQHGKRTGGTRPNRSSRRAALVGICAEALKRERELS